MQRRDALKNIGLSVGLMAATPAFISILQSCTGAPGALWTPEFFNPEEGNILSKMVDVIIPSIEGLPGAEELNVPQFIDKYINEVYTLENQELIRAGMKAFIDKLGAKKPEDLLEVKQDEVEKIIASALKAGEDRRREWQKKVNAYKDTGEGAGPEDKDALVFGFVKEIRGKTIQGYKISEYIGKEVLAYAPVPGTQEGCISLEEATGGKLWAF